VFDMAWERPVDEPNLGARLMDKYRVRTPDELMSCSTCHR